MLFFISCITGIILFSILAENNESKFCLFLATVLLICVTGLRAESVGIDTTNYYYQFKLISKNSPFVAINEAVFVSLCKLLMQVLPEYWMLIFVFSCIIGIFIMLRLWDFRDRISFSTTVVLFLIFHLTASMNIMRQYISVAILFYASRYLEKGKSISIRFLAGQFIACCFHFSAIVGISLIPMMILCNKTIKNRYIKLLLILGMAAPFGLVVLRRSIGNYSFFLNNMLTGNIGIGLIAKFAVLVLFWITCIKQIDNDSKDYLNYLCLIDMFYILLSSLGYRFIYMNRAALPFSLFEVVLYSYMIHFPTKYRFQVAQRRPIGESSIPVYILCIYVIYQSIVFNGHGIFPYIPVWQ